MYSEYQQTNHSTGHEFMSGLLFGAVVGAAVGLLFAPKSGAETRGQVVDSASRMRKQAGKTYERASSVVSEAVDRGRDAWNRGRESFEETRDAIARETASTINQHTS
jgi:gas vesicle protein